MIHVRTLSRVITILLMVVALFMASSAIWSLVDGEVGMARWFLIPSVSVLGGGALLLLALRGDFGELSTRDGFLLVSAAWVAASAVGALPFWLSGAIPSYVDAYFETMSGFTTTGASILTDIEALPRSMLFWRSLTHWLGGMGIIVLTVALLPLLGVGGLQLIRAEAPGPTVDRLTPKITGTAKILWTSYLVLSLIETVLLLLGGMTLFDALTHTFGTMATGGFSPRAASVGAYDSPFIQWVITIFMVAAGINFVMYFRAVSGRFNLIARDTELRIYLTIFVAATLLATFSLWGARFDTFGASLRHGAFQVASILTTTGFATDDFAVWPAFAQIVLYLLMFVGGCSGSTGGGPKVVRIVTTVKQGWNEMRHLIYPSGVFSIRMNGERIRTRVTHAISGFLALYATLALVTTATVAAAGNDIVTSVSTALATLGNIGPGFGRVGPALNYAFFPQWLKAFLSVVMLLGRLEIYTVLVLFTGSFWRRQ